MKVLFFCNEKRVKRLKCTQCTGVSSGIENDVITNRLILSQIYTRNFLQQKKSGPVNQRFSRAYGNSEERFVWPVLLIVSDPKIMSIIPSLPTAVEDQDTLAPTPSKILTFKYKFKKILFQDDYI